MSDLTAIKNNEILKPFFDRHPDFDLKTFNFFDQDAVTALNWEGLELEAISDRLKGYQRLLRLGVESEHAVQLYATEHKLDSALAIASRSQSNFIQVSNLEPETARTIHRKATQKTKGLLMLFANFIQFSSPRQAATLFNNAAALEQDLQSLPSYQELFGSLDYLQCEDCQSIFSPAAYLVDLLRIVDEYITQVNPNIPQGLTLNGRRPDLQNIPLTCDKTNDTMPYVEIVSQVLEETLRNDLSGDPFKDMAEASYPQSLPFNAYLEQNRIYLNHLNLTSAKIYSVFHPQTPRDNIWAREYIWFSPEAYTLITTQNIDDGNIAQRYGVSGEPGNNFWGLTGKDTFIQQTQISVQELNDLLYQNLSEDEITNNVAALFYINKDLGSPYLKLSNTGEIENLNLDRLDRVDRFLRLAHQLGWSFADLDCAIASLEANDINAETSQKIAQIKELQAQTALPCDVLCSFWYDMKTIGKGDKPNVPQDLFDRVYNNPFTAQGQARLDLTSPISWNISDSSVVTNRLIAALQLNNDELIKIAKGIWGQTTAITLDLAILSRLFRTSQMLKLIKFNVDEYTLLLQILGKDFQTLDRIALAEFNEILEFAQWLEKSDFNVSELNYIITGTEDIDVDIFLREEDMFSSMQSLWIEVQLPTNRNDLLDNQLNQEIADHFGIDSVLFRILAKLGAESSGSNDYIALLLEEVSSPGEDWDNIVGCLKYISRMDLLVEKLNLTTIELEKMEASPEAYNISSLTAPTYEDVQSFYRFKEQFLNAFNQPEDNLLAYLAATLAATPDVNVPELAQLTGWESGQISAAIDYLGDNASAQSVAGILILKQCFDLATRLGCNIDFLCEFCTLLTDGTVANNWGDSTELTYQNAYQNTANSITGLVKAKYDKTQWIDVFAQLDGEWQESKCKVLKEFAVWKLDMEDSRQLSEYILLDVETTGCACNSEIQLAMLSVQTYLQRCRMGMETGVTTVDISPTWWDWLMNYRNWEANRKVFLYPENYIDPSLRQDASPLFKELQDKLLQSEVTAASVEEAYTEYFDSLYELSKLQIIDACYYPVKSPKSFDLIDTLFLVAKTVTEPHKFYYRQCEEPKADKPTWGYWQEIDIQIEADYVSLIYAFNRLFIFWIEVQEIVQGDTNVLEQRVVKYSFLTTNKKWAVAQLLVKKEEVDSDLDVGFTEDFFDQVYPVVELIQGSEGSKVEMINVLLGGFSGIPFSDFNIHLKDYIAALEPLAKIASDFLPVLETSDLSQARSNLAATTTNNNLVIFAGGEGDPTVSFDTIDVFQYREEIGSVVKSGSMNLDQPLTNLAVTTVNNLVVFAGGYNMMTGTFSDDVYIFECQLDGTLEKSSNPVLKLSERRSKLVAATVGNLVVFAGGVIQTGSEGDTDTIDIFLQDTDGTLREITDHGLRLSMPREGLAVTTVADKFVIFAGGDTETIDIFEYVGDGLIAITNHGLSLESSRKYLAGTSVNNLAVFAGGYSGSQYFKTVDVFCYGSDGTWSKLDNEAHNLRELFIARSHLVGATVGNCVIFAGGKKIHPTSYFDRIDVFEYFEDEDQGKGNLQNVSNLLDNKLALSNPRSDLAATAVGHLVLLGGGKSDTGCYTNVDIFNLFRPEINELPPSLNLSNDTTVSPIKSESAGFVLQSRGTATAFYDIIDSSDISKRLTTDLIQQLSQKLFSDGFDGLLSLESQLLKEPNFPLIPSGPLDFDGAYGPYFWEIFFHIPFLIASTLNIHNSYDSARVWYQYIFNPTIGDLTDSNSNGGLTNSNRFWRFLPFQDPTAETLKEILTNQAAIQAYQEDPYDPHVIARLRISAYQKAVVMKYIDNLIDWGDALFTRDNWESINQATTLYLVAYDLLGPKPENLGQPPTPEPMTFDKIQSDAPEGSLPEFLIDLENYSEYEEFLRGYNDYIAQFEEIPLNALDAYFCVSENAYFAQYWDRVEERLYKIRHCQNIQGIERQLALFSPPIDPMQLVGQTASGDVMTSFFTADTVPHYRFSYLLDRAKNMTSRVIQLGSTLLATLEKKDAEALALLQASQQQVLLEMITTTKQEQIEEARASLEALEKSLASTQYRNQYYQNLLSVGLSSGETATINLMARSIVSYTLSQAIQGTAIAAYLLPNIFGTSNGGMNFGDATNTSALIAQSSSGIRNQQSTLAATNAQFQRRAQDWEFQQKMAEWDSEQILQQIAAASIRVEMALADLDLHKKSMEQAREIEQFLQDKFTNQQLSQWMFGQLSALYFQTYKLALEMAAAADKAYQYEINTDNIYIRPTYWNSTKQGLLAGESLMLSLDQLETSYLDRNRRSFEIDKIISLCKLDPFALLDLQTKGRCCFSFDQKLFAFDFPSHYRRKIKTVSVSIPAVVGPYQNVNATLTQTSSKVLMEADPEGVRWLNDPQGQAPSSIRESWRSNQQIALSKGIDDRGLFVLNFQDERYLPFEGTGAISEWSLEMPKATNPIDFDSITDVIITLSYTALNGDSMEEFTTSVTSAINKFTGSFSLNLQQQLWQNSNPNSLSFIISTQLFRPNLANYKITKIYVWVFEADGYNLDSDPYNLELDIPDITPILLSLRKSNGIISGISSDLTEEYNLFAQTWSLKDLNRTELLTSQKLRDIVLVVEYECDITWPS